jgi:hypothetical protein
VREERTRQLHSAFVAVFARQDRAACIEFCHSVSGTTARERRNAPREAGR